MPVMLCFSAYLFLNMRQACIRIDIPHRVVTVFNIHTDQTRRLLHTGFGLFLSSTTSLGHSVCVVDDITWEGTQSEVDEIGQLHNQTTRGVVISAASGACTKIFNLFVDYEAGL